MKKFNLNQESQVKDVSEKLKALMDSLYNLNLICLNPDYEHHLTQAIVLAFVDAETPLERVIDKIDLLIRDLKISNHSLRDLLKGDL